MVAGRNSNPAEAKALTLEGASAPVCTQAFAGWLACISMHSLRCTMLPDFSCCTIAGVFYFVVRKAAL